MSDFGEVFTKPKAGSPLRSAPALHDARQISYEEGVYG